MGHSILDGLNEAQQEAVQHPAGPLLILAGAGTGKTRTITRRVAWLVHGRGVPARRLLAITFTNKAAREMRHRIAEWVPATGMWVGTFHATCARMLRQDAGLVGRSPDFTIVDREDRRRLLTRILKDLDWDPKVFRPRRMEELISEWKRRRVNPEGAAEEATLEGLTTERAALLYARYEEALQRQDCLDFDDLLLKGLELVERDAEGPQRWRHRFDHVLVDEYQDTNELQYLFVRQLVAATGNLAVCGDPDQSIYSWRGADIRNILRFDEDFPGARVVRLEENYRSVANILTAAQALIRHNRARREKDLRTGRGPGPPLGVAQLLDEDQEALAVAEAVQEWIQAGTPPREVAIFYRTNACSRALEAAFTRLQIPYQVVGGLSFFERREIKDLLAYARTLVNPRDDSAVERILNVPPRGIGETTRARIRAWAGEHELPLLETMYREDLRRALGSRARKAVEAFLTMIRSISREEGAERTLRLVLERTGYRRYAAALGDTEDVDRGENIDELLAFAAEYDEREGGGLRGFLQEVSLLTDQDRWEEDAQRVSLMTVHTAKGLEFDRVVVVGLEEGLFPHVRALEAVEGLEEERRLLYVALTRAREELLLTCARRRYRTSGPEPQVPSRFLDELPRELLVPRESGFPDETLEAAGGWYPDEEPQAGGGVREGVVRTEVRREEVAEGTALEPDPGEGPFRAGDYVRHHQFGIGQVLRVQGRGISQRVVVCFEDDEDQPERHLLVAYARLEHLG